MTDNEQNRCTEFARRIAKLKPDWAVVGMCARDAAGDLWRRLDDTIDGQENWHSYGKDNSRLTLRSHGAPQLTEAISNGPDFTDAATIGALLMVYLPDHFVTFQVSNNLWRIVKYQTTPCDAPTRAEGILKAVASTLELANA